MIEALVAIVIVALLATLVVPRFIATASRQAEVEAQGVSMLLSAAAARASISSDRVAIEYDQATRLLKTEVASEDQDGVVIWRVPATVRPMTLTTTAIESTLIGARVVDASTGWRVEFGAGRDRPIISVLLTLPGVRPGEDGLRWQVDLPAGESAGSVRSLGEGMAWSPSRGRGVDLDETGRRTKTW
jgi:type II secretory pathway pseudopilin PulG